MRLGHRINELVGWKFWQMSMVPIKIHERHRHRYEVNNSLIGNLVNAGLVIGGTSAWA